MEGPEFERQKANILDALEGARMDYIGATDPVEAEIQMTAIDHLLDVAITSGFLAVDQTLED